MQILDARFCEFEPHHPRHDAADDAGEDREDQIEGADVLVVRRHEPTGEETRRVMVAITMAGRGVGGTVGGSGGSDIGHCSGPRSISSSPPAQRLARKSTRLNSS